MVDRAYELSAPGGSAGLLPVPRPFTSTVGRSREVAQVSDLLLRPDIRLVVLTGPGGIGKTRLAVEVAHSVSGKFAHGAIFIPLAPVREPAGLLSAIAARVSVREAGGRPLNEVLVTQLLSRELLLVLDNFEQITQAAPVLFDLLDRCPRIKMLVTSRAVLHVTGEHLFPVPPLALTGAPDDESHPEAVQLFEDRARSVLPDFRLGDRDAPAVLDICRKLDGLPLAIELAAARLRHLPLDVLGERLDRQLSLLSQGPRDQPARLQTMRNAIAWSYELLDPEQRRLFRSLSVFAGGFTLDAASAVSGIDDQTELFDRVADLLDCSLLRQRTDRDGQPRYGMLEVIREFGFEQLERAGDVSETRWKLAEWCISLVEAGWPEMVRRTNQDIWLLRYEAEMANFRVAMSWLDAQGDGERFVQLTGGLFWFWYVHGQFSEGRYWIKRALQHSPSADYDRFNRGRALYGQGILSHFQGDLAVAIQFVEQAGAEWAAIENEWGQGVVHLLLGLIATDRGDYEHAKQHIEQAIRHALNEGDRVNYALGLYHLGIIHWGLGDLAEGARLCRDALSIQRELGDRWGAANSLEYLGLFAALQGDVVRSNELQQASVECRLEIGTPYWTEEMTKYLADIALLAVRCGQPDLSAELFGAEHRMRSEIGGLRGYPERLAWERASAQAREMLGDRAFEAAWVRGQSIPIEQSFERARGFQPVLDTPDTPVPSAAASFSDGRLLERLTARETEIIELVALGLTNAEIAERIFVTPGTVRIHVSNILRKLDAANRTEAVAIARSCGLLQAT